MKVTAASLAAICAMISPAMGFKIPADQPDGVYEVSEDGVFTKVAEPSVNVTARNVETLTSGGVSTVAKSRIFGRQCWGLCEIGCFSQSVLNQKETDDANWDLDQQIGPGGKGLSSHASVFSKRGATVAYCCNNRSQGNTCYVGVHDQANTLITAKCGWYAPGYAYDSGAHLTYGYRNVHDNFCPK